MKLFKPLLKKEYLESFIKNRGGNITSPKSHRYRKRYDLLFDEASDVLIPTKIINLIGFARNQFNSLCVNYRHGKKFKTIWLKADVYEDGPRVQRREPDNPDIYRRILLLNKVDLFIQSVLASCIRDYLLKNSDFKKPRSRIENISAVRDFIQNSIDNGYSGYLKTDLVKFSENFDLDIAKNTIIPEFKGHCDSDDIELLNNVYNSFLQLPVDRCSGSPLIQLFADWMLFRFENHLNQKLKGKNFIRFGEDLIFSLNKESEYISLEQGLNNMAKEVLGDQCMLHDTGFPRVSENTTGTGVPVTFVTDNNKGVVGSFIDHGIEFCGYYYSIDKGEIKVRLRDRTFTKLKERIKEYTDGNTGYYELPVAYQKNKKIIWMIRNLNNLMGYYRTENGWRYSKELGVGQLFCLPLNIDRTLILEQARILNHYMLLRLRHLHMRNVPGEGWKKRREEIDKSYRKLGLRTVIDSINRLGGRSKKD